MGVGSSLDKRIYSFFKKGVFDGDLQVLGNYIVTRTLESAAEEYALKVSATVEDSNAGICKFGVFGNMLLTTGALVAEVWGGYSKTRLSGGQATGQVGAHYFEFIVDSGVANCPSAQVIQLASWINGALNAVHGFITFRDYGSAPMTNLFNIMDITSGTGKLWYGNTLKIRIGGAAKYLVLADTENPVVIGAVSGLGLSMAPPAAGAGLKIHTHAATGAVYDYANEFKGESVRTSSFYDGLALDYQLDATGTSILRAIRATVQLNSGKTMNGTDYATQSMLAAGVFQASVSGTISGAGVTVAGVLGQIGSNDLGTLTTCKYMAAVWADWASHVQLGTGISAIILATVGEGVGAATVDYGIYMAGGGHVTTGIALVDAYTNGIDLTGATLTEGSDNALFSIGSYSAAKVVALTTTAFYTPFQINLLSSTNPSGGETIMAGAYIKVANDTIAQAAMNSVALNLRNTIGTSLVSAYGLQSHMTFVTTAEIDGAGTAAAVSGKITLGHANTSGVIAVGYFTLDGGFGPAVAHGVWIDIVGVGTIATNGLVIAGTGAMNKGINLSGAIMVEGTDNALFCIGSYSSAKSVTLLTDAFYVPFHINILSTANPSGGETVMSGTYIKAATTGNQAAMNLVGETLRVTVGGNVAQAYGIQCHLTVAGACVAGTNANVCAASFQTIVNAAMTATVNVLLLTYDGTGAVTGETNMITIDPLHVVKNGIMVYDTANLTNLFEFAANAGCVAGASKATQTAASVGSIKIVIGGTDYYIPYFA